MTPELPACPMCDQKADPRFYRRGVMMCDGCWPQEGITSPAWTRAVDRVLDRDVTITSLRVELNSVHQRVNGAARLVWWDERLRALPNVEWHWREHDGFWYIGTNLSPETIVSLAEIASWKPGQWGPDADLEREKEMAMHAREIYPEFARLVDARNQASSRSVKDS